MRNDIKMKYLHLLFLFLLILATSCDKADSGGNTAPSHTLRIASYRCSWEVSTPDGRDWSGADGVNEIEGLSDCITVSLHLHPIDGFGAHAYFRYSFGADSGDYDFGYQTNSQEARDGLNRFFGDQPFCP